MGNFSLQHDSELQIQQLNVTEEEKRNLNIFVWRSLSETNQHIPKTRLTFTPNSQPQLQLSCRGFKGDLHPIVTFEKYLCDFKPLIGFLNLPQSLTLFHSVIKGHQTIFSKFNSTIVHQNCSFLTHNGQARIWINPNYFLNSFWTQQKQQFKFRTSSVHEAKCQTPRFMNKEEFEFQSIALLSSEGVIIKKIVDWIPKFIKKSKQSIEFLVHLQKFIKGNILSNCSFQRVERFIHTWAYQKKIHLKTNIEETIKMLIEEGRILNDMKDSEKSTKKLSKRRLSTNFTDAPRKQRHSINLVSHQEIDDISVFDIRNLQSQNIFPQNSNLSHNIGNSTKDGGNSFKRISKINNNSRTEDLQTEQKISIKQRKFNHRRKAPNSFMNEQLEPCTQTVPQIEQIQSQRSVVYQNVDFWSLKSKQFSISGSRYSKKNINNSYQYSIAIINSNQNKNSNKSLDQEKKNLQASTDISQTLKLYQFESSRPRNSSKMGPILKKSNKSFDLSNQKFMKGDQKQSVSKKKHPVVFQTQQNYLSDGCQEHKKNHEKQKINSHRHSGDDLTIQNRDVFNVMDRRVGKNIQTQRTATKTPQNSSFETPRDEKNNRFSPFKLITNIETCSKKVQQKMKLNFSDKFQTPETPEYGNVSDGKASMMNMKYLSDQIKEQIQRSKLRISVGGGQAQLMKLSKAHSQIECCKTSIINNAAQQCPKTINGLFSSQNKLQTSFGSISSGSNNDFNSQQNNGVKYSGVLSKMGRSVQFRKTLDSDLQKSIEFEGGSNKGSDEMPNFIKKRTIGEHGVKRSVKF